MSDYSLENFERPQLETPNGEQRILMHSCCCAVLGRGDGCHGGEWDRDDDIFL